MLHYVLSAFTIYNLKSKHKKKFMKKILITLILFIVVIIAAVSYYLLTNLDALVKAGIEKYGSEVTHTAVRVDQVQIKLTDGAGTIKGLTIANPEGFETDFIFSLGEVTTEIDLESLKQEPYIINEVTVREPQVVVEVNANKKTNLNELKKTLMGGTTKKSTTSNTADAQNGSNTQAPRIIIRRLIFSKGNIQVLVKPLNNKKYTLKLSSINMKNLGGKKGATPTELSKEIINRLIDQAKKDVKQKGIDAELDKLKTKFNTKINQEKAKLKSKSDAKLNKEKQKLKDKLKNILK